MSFTTDKPNKKSCKHKRTWELSRTPSRFFLIYMVSVSRKGAACGRVVSPEMSWKGAQGRCRGGRFAKQCRITDICPQLCVGAIARMSGLTNHHHVCYPRG